jgi:hypothetical protein
MGDAERYLDRTEAAEYLRGRGLQVSPTTLQKWASIGGGPLYFRWGHRAVYLRSDLDGWAAEKLSQPARTYAARAEAGS